MALLDRFRTQSRHKNPDAAVRLAFVQEIPLEERELLTEIAREDTDPRVRRAAVAKLMDPAALAGVARDDADEHVRSQAIDDAARHRARSVRGPRRGGERRRGRRARRHEDAGRHRQERVARVDRAARAGARHRSARARLDRPARRARNGAPGGVRSAAGSRRDPERRAQLRVQGPDARGGRSDHGSRRARADRSRARRTSRRRSARAAILREADERAAQERPRRPKRPGAARARRSWPRRQPRLRRIGRPSAKRRARAGGSRARRARPRERQAGRRTARAPRQPNSDARAAGGGRACAARSRPRPNARVPRPPAEAARKEAARRHARLDRAGRRGREGRAARRPGGRAASLQRHPARVEQPGGRGAAEPDVALRYAEAETAFTARDNAAHEEDQRARREALARLQQLVGRIEPIATRADLTLKAGERALKDIRTALGTIPQLPSKKDYDEIVRRLKAAQTALMPKVQELRDVADWQRWANVGIQEQLCEKMEALKAVEDPEEIAKQVRDLQQQWRQAADVPRAQGEALWRRFKAAHDDGVGAVRGAFRRADRGARREPGEEDRAERARRGARRARPTGFRPPTRSRSCRPSGRRSARSAAARKRRSGSASAPPAIGSSPAATPISPSARRCGRRTWRRRRRSASRSRRSRDSTDWDDDRRRDQAAAGRVEDDRPGEEDALRGDVAALPRRLRRVLRPLRAAPRHRARRTARGARGDCRGAGRTGRDSVASRRSKVGRRRPDVGQARAAGPSDRRRRAQPQTPSPQSRAAVRSRAAIRNPRSAIGGAARRSDGARALAARHVAGGARRARRRPRSRGGARRAVRRGVQRRPRAVAGGLRRHRSRSRREPQADGSAGAPDGGSREVARRPGVGERRRRAVADDAGWRRC